MHCTNCGIELAKKCNFCSNCGKAQTMHCSNCGIELTTNCNFCSNCGKVSSKAKEFYEKLDELQEKVESKPPSKPVYISCQEIQDNVPGAVSGVYKIHPLPIAEPIEVYCEMAIGGGGFNFLPRSLTRRPDAQQIVDALFKDKRNVLLKLQKKVDRSESYTLIQPHPSFANTDFGVLVNSYSGYTTPQNDFMKDYIFFGIIPSSFVSEPKVPNLTMFTAEHIQNTKKIAQTARRNFPQ